MLRFKPSLRLLAAAAVLGTAQAASAAMMYIANNSSDTMFVVNTATVSSSTLGATGVNLGFGGLGFASGGQLYGWTTSAGLHTVNAGTGAWTAVAGGPTVACGDTFDINPATGIAYVVDICNGRLHTVDLLTAATTPGATLTGWAVGAGSAFAEDGSLYFVDIGGNNIRRTDPNTGVTTVVGPTGINQTITNLAYNPDDDMLYAVGIDNAQLFRFDPTTGAGTSLGVIAGLPTGGQITMATIQVAAAAVPEPAGLGLALAGLLGLAAARRRTRA